MHTPKTPTIKVLSDYDGYFESLVKRWLDKVPYCPFETVEITAGPYRSSALSFEIKDEGKTIAFDFYSALRNGFGALAHQDVDDIIALLTNGRPHP